MAHHPRRVSTKPTSPTWRLLREPVDLHLRQRRPALDSRPCPPDVPKLASFLTTGGALAFQMLNNLDEPALTLQYENRRKTAPGATRSPPRAACAERFGAMPDYYNWLSPDCQIDMWQTTYVHLMKGAEAIVEWISRARPCNRFSIP